MARKTATPVERPHAIRLATLGLLAVAMGLLAYMLFLMPPQQPPVLPTPTPMVSPSSCPQGGTTPAHSAAEAKAYVARVMASYSDMMYGEVPTPAFNPCNGEWEATVTMYRNGVMQRAFLRLNDTPLLMLDKAYLEGPRPPAISEDMVVTNGTLRIAGKIACTPEAGCGNKTCVWEFADPYDRYSVAAEEKMNSFISKYNDSIDFTYKVVLTQSLVLENSYGKEDVERISKYFVCAQEQGLLAPLKACALNKYSQKAVDAPLSTEELDSCLPVGLDNETFGACLPTAYARIASDKTVAETYLGVGSVVTPRVVFGCQYRVHPSYLEHGFCFVHPEAAGCS